MQTKRKPLPSIFLGLTLCALPIEDANSLAAPLRPFVSFMGNAFLKPSSRLLW